MDAFYLILKSNFFLLYQASNMLGIELIEKNMDLFTSDPAAIVLFVQILARNSQWDSPDRKKLEACSRKNLIGYYWKYYIKQS